MCEYPIGNGLVSSLYLKTLSVEEGFLSSAIIKKAGCFYSSSGALIQKICSLMSRFWFVAGATGFEPAISALTGPHVRPLHHGSIDRAGSSLLYMPWGVKGFFDVLLAFFPTFRELFAGNAPRKEPGCRACSDRRTGPGVPRPYQICQRKLRKRRSIVL